MTMTPRELVRRTLEFDRPERVPRQLWLLPWAEARYPDEAALLLERFPDDIVGADPHYKKPLPIEGDRYKAGRSVDEWGCVFANIQDGAIGQVKDPQIRTWQDLDRVRIPVERLTVDIEKVDAFCRAADEYVLAGCCPRPFERLQFLRGTENLFYDLMDRPPELDVLVERIHEFYMRELETWTRTAVDGLMIMDDWGTQNALIIAPDLWREIFKPLYADYVRIAHDGGKAFFMHSDGYILDIMDDLVEIGIDAVNSQVFCMGVEELGKRFRGKITFWGELDRQHILPAGTRDEVLEAVRLMKDCLYADGGLIAQCEFGLSALPENVMTFFEGW